MEAEARSRFGKPYDQLPLRDQARVQDRAAKQSEKNAFGLPTPISGLRHERAFVELQERRARLSRALPESTRAALRKAGVELEPSGNYVTVRDQELTTTEAGRLTLAEKTQRVTLDWAGRRELERLTAEEMAKLLPKHEGRLAGRSVPMQQEKWRELQADARRRAEQRFLRSTWRSAPEK
jgi:hypothetical protein